jgi:glycosyltransferase involved in cell wall biosynthesis
MKRGIVHNDRTILKIVPSLRARRLPDGRIVLTRKFIEGVNEFQRFWDGPVEVYMECSDDQYDNLDELPSRPEDFPFRVHVLSLPQIARMIAGDRDAVVLLSLDDFRQSGLGKVCRENGVACAYISEYSLATRKRIVDIGTTNPVKRLRRKLWEVNQERKRRTAVASAAGLQCNGTPTYDDYLPLSENALLYFDTRVAPDLLATADDVRQRWAALNSGGPLRLLYSGRLVPAKGAHDLVDVAKRLCQRNVDFHLFICGDGESAPGMSERIRREQLNERVTLTGVLDFKTELLPFARSNIDLFVCCHPQGDPSCTYLETMSCGVPIAGYANEAFEGIVRHSECGWTVAMNQPEALADKIADVGKSPDLLLSMSLASLAFARSHTFDQTFSRRVIHLRCLAERNARGYEEAKQLVVRV